MEQRVLKMKIVVWMPTFTLTYWHLVVIGNIYLNVVHFYNNSCFSALGSKKVMLFYWLSFVLVALPGDKNGRTLCHSSNVRSSYYRISVYGKNDEVKCSLMLLIQLNFVWILRGNKNKYNIMEMMMSIFYWMREGERERGRQGERERGREGERERGREVER
jgi:hypothetical protein